MRAGRRARPPDFVSLWVRRPDLAPARRRSAAAAVAVGGLRVVAVRAAVLVSVEDVLRVANPGT
jgi:hypothetical protein